MLFYPQTMRHVTLFTTLADAPNVAILLAKSGCFDPHSATQPNPQLPDGQGENYRQHFQQAYADWQKIKQYMNLDVQTAPVHIEAVTESQLQTARQQLAGLWQQCLAHKNQQHGLAQQLQDIRHLFDLLDNFQRLDINLAVLRQDLQFLDLRLGLMPSLYVKRLSAALQIEGFLLSVYFQREEQAHVVVAGLKQSADNIHSLLESCSFQRISVPDEFHAHPKTVQQKLHIQQEMLLKQQDELEQQRQKLQQNHQETLRKLGQLLTLAKPYALLSQTMQCKGQLTQISGWIPACQQAALQQHATQSKLPVVMLMRAPTVNEYRHTPSQVLPPRWMQPFLALIRNYGVTAYREFDPSWLFSLSYILLFGVMFGDVGHGLCLLAVAGAVKRKHPNFFSFFVAIGLSSVTFGFVYGSVFAFEHWLPALWLSPISQPLLMLELALAGGAGFIVLLNLISIYNYLMNKQWQAALFSATGLVGLSLYLILWAVLWLESLAGGWLLLPLGLLLLYHGWHSDRPWAERLLVSVIETYDVIIALFSHTLSFLRVAAFALNHSALAIALFALADLTDGATHALVLVLGNVFIVVLEGAIVAIQVLRLEYYEGFSRYFHGDGRLFQPLRLSPDPLTHSIGFANHP